MGKATFQVHEDAAGAWRWRLVHDNGDVIADGGQGYTSNQRALTGLRSVKQHDPDAPVETHRVDELDDQP